ncbi:MAG TPA: pyridoxamine 5'-phosphate oxidase family protein [Ilumatobacter sp.]|nr:pyridoxamine 5'-phosphate oxidase family protein [Ilumatobacter sp.]
MTTQRMALQAWESTELLRSRSVGRICVIDHGFPVAIPINYEVVGNNDDARLVERIVIRTAPDTIVGRYEGLGSIEVDDIDFESSTAWSVIVRGTIAPTVGDHDLPDPEPLVDTNRERWMTLSVSAITGRRFAVHRATDGHSVVWRAENAER